MAQRVDPAERLLDLVIALTHTERWMTKQQVRERVHGYSGTASVEAFERMFERDKDLLREMGVPLVVAHSAAHEDDVGYRIDTDGYEMPPISFTPAEAGVLALAAELWQDATLTSSARRGMTKLRAVGPAPEPDAHAGLALRVRGPEPTFAPLLDAVNQRRAVTFTYRAGSTGQVARRTVQPWRLLSRHRGWYVVGTDVDRGAPRAFRLSRIEGRVRLTGPAGAYDIPEAIDAAPMVERAESRAGTALVALLPERGAALRARATTADPAVPEDPPSGAEDREVFAVPFVDLELLADELATYADAALVLDPPELRAAVLRRLAAVARLVPTGDTDG